MSRGLFDTYLLAKEKDAGITVQGKIEGWNTNKHNLRLDLIICNQPVKIGSRLTSPEVSVDATDALNVDKPRHAHAVSVATIFFIITIHFLYLFITIIKLPCILQQIYLIM